MYLFRFILDQINQNYAMTFPPLDMAQIKRFSITMKKAGLDVVPSDYAAFLCWTDGLYWNGLELFSVYSHERPDTVYPHPTLMDVQQKKPLEDAFNNKIILGRGFEELICYDSVKKLYEILDRYTYQPILQYARFADLLYFYACYNKGSVTSPTETAS